MDILKSASKIVFMFMAVSAFILVILGKIDGKDYFVLATAAFSFYFSNKGETNQKYAGK
jgi:hypothetical protein